MSEQIESRVRMALSSVEQAELSPVETIGERVAGVERRRARRRRTVTGIGAVVLTIGAVAMVWSTSTGPAQVTTGDGVRTTTVADSSTPATGPTQGTAAWADVPPDPRGPVVDANVVWTGSEALMVGGVDQAGDPVDGVIAFEPATMTWTELSADPVPLMWPIVHWTGDRVLAVGWWHDVQTTAAASFDPVSGEWTMGAVLPFGFKGGPATPNAWTGTSLLLWSADRPMAYVVADDEWIPIAMAPLDARNDAASVWTGTEWIVWGGHSFEANAPLGDGAAYDPTSDSWRTIAPSPLSPRLVDGVWSGDEMIVMAGRSSNVDGMTAYSDGAAYDPVSDRWRPLQSGPAHPGANLIATEDSVVFFAKGGYSVYDVSADRWDLDVQGTGRCFDGNSAVFTGRQILLLGCYDGGAGGAIFTPDP